MERRVVIPIKLQGGQNPGGFLSDIAKLVLRMFAPIYKPILRKKKVIVYICDFFEKVVDDLI